jgi:hypothetical protein
MKEKLLWILLACGAAFSSVVMYMYLSLKSFGPIHTP